MPSPAPPPGYNQQRPLATPRTLLTSILNSLSSSPASTATTTSPDTDSKSTSAPLSNTIDSTTPTNPLRSLSTAQKSLLATLHVLFPQPTFLQALDLLDKRLVTRICISTKTPISPRQRVRANMHHPETSRTGDRNRANTLYQVRSAQNRSRFATHVNLEPAGALVYTVRLGAWSCDCAAFAFAAFPAENAAHERLDWDTGEWDGEGKGWEVGGLSFNGMGKAGDEGVPVCKHLLACLLAEKWEAVFGEYVKEMEVGREEGAGIGGA